MPQDAALYSDPWWVLGLQNQWLLKTIRCLLEVSWDKDFKHKLSKDRLTSPYKAAYA